MDEELKTYLQAMEERILERTAAILRDTQAETLYALRQITPEARRERYVCMHCGAMVAPNETETHVCG